MTTTSPATTKPKRRWLQFSLRTMMVLMLVFGCGFGWFGKKIRQAREQDETLRTLAEAHGYCQNHPSEASQKLRNLVAIDLVPPWLEVNLFFDVTDVSFSQWGRHGAIDSIIKNPHCVDDSLVSLERLPSLRCVELAGTNITDKGLRHLARLRSLESLGLGVTSVSDAGLTHLKPLVNLQSLILANTQVTDAGLVNLEHLARLQVLALGNELIADPGFQHRGQIHPEWHTWRKKWFPWTTRITDAGLVHIRGLTQLRHLDLCSSEITDAGLIHLSTLTMLKILAISHTQVTDVGLGHLQRFAELEHLDVSDTAVNDAGLEYLRNLAKLETLDLTGTKITDTGLVHLDGLMSLKQLWLEDTSVSDDGVRGIRKLLPNLEVFDARGVKWEPLAMFPDTGEARLP